MISVVMPEFQQGLLRLGRLNLEFWHRTLRLSVYGAESFGRRLQRLQTQVGQELLNSISRSTSSENGPDNNDDSEAVMRAFSDAYMEEMLNSEQVALITFEELQVWFSSFCEEWRSLASSTSNAGV